MNTPKNDDFQQSLQIAEFAARRGEDRRQYEFKIFISYVTLLVLAIYKHDLLITSSSNAVCCVVICVLLVLIHLFYISWTIRLSVANDNDSARRNFYLQKTEYISECLLKRFGEPLCRGMKIEYPKICPEDNEIKKVPGPFEAFKHVKRLWDNYAATFQFIFPTILFILLIISIVES